MTLPILPMGTLMATAMVLVALALLCLASQRRRIGAGRAVQLATGALALMAGCWQLLWYAPRHLDSHWGQMAALSGIALLGAATLLLPRETSTAWQHARWPLTGVLTALGGYYLFTIARL